MLKALILCSLSWPLVAQEALPTENQPATPPGGSEQVFAAPTAFTPRDWNWSRATLGVDYSYVGAGRAQYQGVKLSSSDAHAVNASLAGAIALNEKWFVPIGLHSGNFFLDPVGGAPVPDDIHTLRLMAGLGYRINEQWSIAASVGPEFYRLDNMDTSDIGVAGTVQAVWRWRRDVTFAFGLGINPDSDVPVLPAAGVRWAIRTNLLLNLMFPRPVLLYRAAPRLNLFAGADIKFAVFRAEKDFGTELAQPQYNNALGTYHDFHLGAGAEYEVARRLFLSIEGGCSVGRELDYRRIGQTVKFDPGAYGQVGLKYRF